MNNLLEWQADRIEAVLSLHKVPVRVTGGAVTPRWVRFDALPSPGAKISKIKGLGEELAAALGAPSCRVARRGAVVAIEVPRDDPRPVRFLSLYRQLDEDGVRIPPITAILGLAEDGAPLLIRLPSPDVAHILVAGTTGSGKTVLLQGIILSLALTNSPPPAGAGDGDLALVLIDPKGHAFGGFERLPHLARPVIRDIGEATEALHSLVRLMERRGAEPSPHVVVVIDELADLLMTGGEAVQYPLTRLTQRGREAGIHIAAATQKPTAAVLGPLVKANFPVRLVGRVASADDARVASGWTGTGAERLLGRGDFIAVAEGRVIRFQAAHISPDEIAALVERKGWQSPTVDADRAAVSPLPAPIPDAPVAPDQVAVLARRLRPWWAEHGGEWGAKTRAVRYLFGDEAPAGGMFWELTVAAIARIEQDSTPTPTPPEAPHAGAFAGDGLQGRSRN